MKNLLFVFIILFVFACKEATKKESLYPEISKTPVELGKEIFEGKGNCFACHQVEQKVIGPSIQNIAKIYKEKNGNIVSFLKDDAKPIVDPSQYEAMKTNFAITKEMSDEELKAIEAYILSQATTN